MDDPKMHKRAERILDAVVLKREGDRVYIDQWKSDWLRAAVTGLIRSNARLEMSYHSVCDELNKMKEPHEPI